MATTTLLDIAKANGADRFAGLIDETVKAHPEILLGEARTINGISYKTWIRKQLPVVGFRNANEGATPSKSVYENRIVDTFIFNPRIEADKAVADSHEDGAAMYLATEAEGTVEASLQLICKQFYYGRRISYGGDVKGFPGLLDSLDRQYELDAGGTTDFTGSSVWAVKFAPAFVTWVWGDDGRLDVSNVSLQRVLDKNQNPYTAYVQEILARPGLQVGNLRGVARLKNLTEDANCGLTDTLLAKLLAKLEVGIRPDVLLMSRRSRGQLQRSRTVTLFGSGQKPMDGKQATVAPTPTEYDGIPIYATDAISDAETLTL
jgi:hypothetical protein